MNNETLTDASDTRATLPWNPQSRKGRDPYADAGKACRTFADEVLGAEKGRKNGEEHGIEPVDVRVAFAVVAHVTGWSRCGDYLEVPELAAAARVHPGTCRRSLRRLSRLTSLVYEPGGHGRPVAWVGFGTPAEVIHKDGAGAAEPDQKNAPPGAYPAERSRHCGATINEKVINEEGGASPVERPGPVPLEPAALDDEPEHTDPVPLDPVPDQTGNPEPGNDADTPQPVPLESPTPSDFRATMEPADILAAMLDPAAGVDQAQEARELADELNHRPSAAGWERHAADMLREGHHYQWKSQLRPAIEERTGARTVADFYRAKAAQRACATCHGSTWTETDEGQLTKCPNCQTGTGTSSTWTSQASPGAAPTPGPQHSPTSSGPPLTPLASPQPAGPSPQPASLPPTTDPAEHLAAARRALAGARG